MVVCSHFAFYVFAFLSPVVVAVLCWIAIYASRGMVPLFFLRAYVHKTFACTTWPFHLYVAYCGVRGWLQIVPKGLRRAFLSFILAYWIFFQLLCVLLYSFLFLFLDFSVRLIGLLNFPCPARCACLFFDPASPGWWGGDWVLSYVLRFIFFIFVLRMSYTQYFGRWYRSSFMEFCCPEPFSSISMVMGSFNCYKLF